jgi:YtkA-like
MSALSERLRTLPFICCVTACSLLAFACRETSEDDRTSHERPGGAEQGAGAGSEGGAGGLADDDSPFAGAGGEAGADGEGGAAPCRNNPLVVDYQPDLTVTSTNGMTVRLTRSSPQPRVGNHTWWFEISSQEGDPVVGATVRVTPFMPEHRHGSPLTAVVEERGEGAYEAHPVEFTMTGYWRTTIRVVTDDWTDAAVVPLCIE